MWTTAWILGFLCGLLPLTLGQQTSSEFFHLTIGGDNADFQGSFTLPITGENVTLLSYMTMVFNPNSSLRTFTTTFYPGQGFYLFAINDIHSDTLDFIWEVYNSSGIVGTGLDSHIPRNGNNILIALVEVPKLDLIVENTIQQPPFNVFVRLAIREGWTLLQYLEHATKQHIDLTSFSVTYQSNNGYTVNMINDAAASETDKKYWSVLKSDIALQDVVDHYVPQADDKMTFRFAEYTGPKPPSPDAPPAGSTPSAPIQQQVSLTYGITNALTTPLFNNTVTLSVVDGSTMIKYMERACDTSPADFQSFTVMYMQYFGVEYEYQVYAVNNVAADWDTTSWVLTNATNTLNIGVDKYVPVAEEAMTFSYSDITDTAAAAATPP